MAAGTYERGGVGDTGKRWFLRAAACSAALAVSGCSTSFSDIDIFSSEPPPCPSAGTLVDAATITEFAKARSTADSNIRYRAEITRSAYDCSVSGNSVTGTVGIVGEVSLGRRGRAGDITLPLFIAVTIRDAEVVTKRFEVVDVTIPRGQKRASFEKIIPNFDFDIRSGRKTVDYELLIGFNLSPEQVAYNRDQLDGS
ncbi:hypothetical protein MNBD_ALPHA09-1463 [hydrothermal vent metagenome]|uniref:Uncharacterized protein n=1 Tax=hydrothermal vent metagenome TaxID=652676 RepID=A0A3B0TCF0_9ZZZZ